MTQTFVCSSVCTLPVAVPSAEQDGGAGALVPAAATSPSEPELNLASKTTYRGKGSPVLVLFLDPFVHADKVEAFTRKVRLQLQEWIGPPLSFRVNREPILHATD